MTSLRIANPEEQNLLYHVLCNRTHLVEMGMLSSCTFRRECNALGSGCSTPGRNEAILKRDACIPLFDNQVLEQWTPKELEFPPEIP